MASLLRSRVELHLPLSEAYRQRWILLDFHTTQWVKPAVKHVRRTAMGRSCIDAPEPPAVTVSRYGGNPKRASLAHCVRCFRDVDQGTVVVDQGKQILSSIAISDIVVDDEEVDAEFACLYLNACVLFGAAPADRDFWSCIESRVIPEIRTVSDALCALLSCALYFKGTNPASFKDADQFDRIVLKLLDAWVTAEDEPKLAEIPLPSLVLLLQCSANVKEPSHRQRAASLLREAVARALSLPCDGLAVVLSAAVQLIIAEVPPELFGASLSAVVPSLQKSAEDFDPIQLVAAFNFLIRFNVELVKLTNNAENFEEVMPAGGLEVLDVLAHRLYVSVDLLPPLHRIAILRSFAMCRYARDRFKNLCKATVELCSTALRDVLEVSLSPLEATELHENLVALDCHGPQFAEVLARLRAISENGRASTP
jgi:hypothetical protein